MVFHDKAFKRVRVGNLAELEPFDFAGGLDVYIAVVENRRNESDHIGRHVLYFREFEIAGFAKEETSLFDVHDTLIRDNPDIHVVVDPDKEGIEPYEEQCGRFDERYGPGSEDSGELREEEYKSYPAAENRESAEKNDEELDEDIEPMAVSHLNDLFALVLFFESVSWMRVHIFILYMIFRMFL